MNVDEAIASVLAAARKHLSGEKRPGENQKTSAMLAAANEDLRDIPVFYMGPTEDLITAQNEMLDDLKEDLKNGLPMPFRSICMIAGGGTEDSDKDEVTLTREIAALRGFPGMQLGTPSTARWTAVLVFGLSDGFYTEPRRTAGRVYFGMVLGYFQNSRSWNVAFRSVFSVGTSDGEVYVENLTSMWPSQRVENLGRQYLTEEMKDLLNNWSLAVAMISHPMNYIVRESPELTPKEQKRIADGKSFPDQKRPRYIVVDHDILVRLSNPSGTHAAPIPHRRRGHWRRLADRCAHQRSRGVERVFVRETYVGETEFTGSGRRYQVLLDFSKKEP